MDGLNTNTIDTAALPDVKHLYPFTNLPMRFDLELMSGHSAELGAAASLLSRAYEASRVIKTISTIILKSGIARDLEKPQLTPSQEHDLVTAISMLSGDLNEALCTSADGFENELTKGGVQ